MGMIIRSGDDLNNLAALLHATNRLGEAEQLYRRALAIFEKSLGPDHPNTVTARGNLAAVLATVGARRSLSCGGLVRARSMTALGRDQRSRLKSIRWPPSRTVAPHLLEPLSARARADGVVDDRLRVGLAEDHAARASVSLEARQGAWISGAASCASSGTQRRT